MFATILALIIRVLELVHPAASQVKENKDAEDVHKAYTKEKEVTEAVADTTLSNVLDINDRLRDKR